MNDLAIYGTGGVGRQAVQIAQDMNDVRHRWNILGYLDDSPTESQDSLNGLPVLGSGTWLQDHPTVSVCLAIASPTARRRVAQRLRSLGHERFASLVHPESCIGARSRIGTGAIIYPGVLIDTDVQVGEHVLINKACTLGHDAEISAFATFAPGVNLGGTTQIGEGCEFGIGSATVQSISVGDWTIVGAGAVVLRNLPANVTAVGVPAKQIKHRQPGWHEETA